MRSLVDEAAPVKKAVGDRVDLRVPNSTEALRLPADYEIGPLGWDDADRAAYDAAMGILNKAAKTAKTGKAVDPSMDEQSLSNLAALGPDPQIHLGSPLVQVEGNLSFLVRFIGKELTCAGEIHLSTSEGGVWTLDTLLLDLPVLKVQDGGKGELSFDPLTYKRFF
jgi:hypothetical protein